MNTAPESPLCPAFAFEGWINLGNLNHTDQFTLVIERAARPESTDDCNYIWPGHDPEQGTSMSDRHFHAQRPAKGKAFHCLGDALALLHIHATGNVDRQSATNDRAINILMEANLIQRNAANMQTPYITTAKGVALVDRIKDMAL